jgi:hypothetical protein
LLGGDLALDLHRFYPDESVLGTFSKGMDVLKHSLGLA